MFHPRPFIKSRFAPQGTVACIRASNDFYYDIVFRWGAHWQAAWSQWTYLCPTDTQLLHHFKLKKKSVAPWKNLSHSKLEEVLKSACKQADNTLKSGCKLIYLLTLFPPAEFMQNFSSMKFQTSPFGSPLGNSLATLFCPRTRPTSDTSAFMSPTTGKSVAWACCSKCRYQWLHCDLSRSQVAKCGHGVAVWYQREQQHGGWYWISATGTAAGTGVSVTTVMCHLSVGGFPDVECVHSWSCSQWPHPHPPLSWMRRATLSTARTVVSRSSLSSRTSTGRQRSVIRKPLDAWMLPSTLSRR